MPDHTPTPETDHKNIGKKKDKAGEKTREHQEDCLDDALEDTFPASDPISPQDPSKPGRG